MGSIVLALLSIAIWSTLALLNTKVAALPALFSAGMALCVGGAAGLVRVRDWKVPFGTLAVGVGGIFGYHALLFSAFRLAPAVEVNLINYLWPLSIVVLSPVFLKGFKLRAGHLAGALLGLVGALLVVSGGKLSLDAAGLPGYLLAASAAFLWAAYSLLTKRVSPFPTGAVGLFCLVSGFLALAVWGADEILRTGALVLPRLEGREILYLALLGLGPMGAAFYTWDAALKRGDPRVIGSLAYLTPLASTLNLVVFGGRRLSPVSALAMGLIVAGAAVGARGSRGAKPKARTH